MSAFHPKQTLERAPAKPPMGRAPSRPRAQLELSLIPATAVSCSDESRESDMRALAIFLSLLLLGVAAYASETITYKYDTRGRLIEVDHNGSVNNNVVTNYVYDKAD